MNTTYPACDFRVIEHIANEASVAPNNRQRQRGSCGEDNRQRQEEAVEYPMADPLRLTNVIQIS